MGTPGGSPGGLTNPNFSPPDQSSFPELEPDESAQAVYRRNHAEEGQSHGEEPMVTSESPSQGEVAREDPTRRYAACDGSGRKRLPEHRAGLAMPASDPSTPRGESADGASYSLKCWETLETWEYDGDLGEIVDCPRCERQIPAYEVRWAFLVKEAEVTAEIGHVDHEIRDVIELRARRSPTPKETIQDCLLDLVELEIEAAVEDIYSQLREEVSE